MRHQIQGWRVAFALALVSAALCGCSHKATPATNETTSAAGMHPTRVEGSDTPDPCGLLDPKEVEAALGAPLAAPPYRSSNATVDPNEDGNECVYETAKFRYIILEPTYEGGAQAYSMGNMVKGLLKNGGGDAQTANNVKKNFRLDDGTEMTGEWDEASLTAMNCCIFNALRGDQMIKIEFTSTPLTLRQAATLVDSAYKRIGAPLKIDGSAGIAAARQLEKTRPQPRDICSLLSSDEVAAILGPLPAPPEAHGQTGCIYKPPVAPGAMPLVYDVEVRWKGGYEKWRSDRYVNHIGMSAVTQVAADYLNKQLPDSKETHDQADQASATPAGDPAESVSDNGMQFVLVKNDVQVSVNAMMTDKARAQALATAVAAKL